MTDHSINTHIMVSSSLAWRCYSMLMLMTLWWPFCFDPDDILWHSGTGQPVRSWHALAHPEFGQELCRWFELNVLCHLTALLPESDLAEHLLPSASPEYHHSPSVYNYTCHSVMIFGELDLNLDVIMPHCLWEIYAMRLTVLFVLLLITNSHFFAQTGYAMFLDCIQTEFRSWAILLLFGF